MGKMVSEFGGVACSVVDLTSFCDSCDRSQYWRVRGRDPDDKRIWILCTNRLIFGLDIATTVKECQLIDS